MDYEKQSPDDSNSLSKLNSGGLINLRLHDLWNNVHRAACKGNYLLWNLTLDRLWSELAADEPKNSDLLPQIQKLNNEISLLGNLPSPDVRLVFKKYNNVDRMKMSKQYNLLMQKELCLRRLQNKQGKGTAYVDDSDYNIVI